MWGRWASRSGEILPLMGNSMRVHNQLFWFFLYKFNLTKHTFMLKIIDCNHDNP